MKTYKFKTNFFGFAASKVPPGSHFGDGKKAIKGDLLWLTDEGLLFSGPGFFFVLGTWLVRLGIFTRVEK